MADARTTLARALVVALVVTGIVCFTVPRNRSSDSPGLWNGGSAGRSDDAPTGAAKSDARASVRPVFLRIPAIGVRTRLEELGLNTDGTVEVPADPDAAGWYGLGTPPGARGSAVILGHVDSVDGPAVFNRLRTLHRGDDVVVGLADGSSVRFMVRSVTTYPNAQFPARAVYAATTGRTLNLVTCGGAYDPARGGYQANVVVHARLMSNRSG